VKIGDRGEKIGEETKREGLRRSENDAEGKGETKKKELK
jgi:hypothetical protein